MNNKLLEYELDAFIADGQLSRRSNTVRQAQTGACGSGGLARNMRLFRRRAALLLLCGVPPSSAQEAPQRWILPQGRVGGCRAADKTSGQFLVSIRHQQSRYAEAVGITSIGETHSEPAL
eukprot:5867155-Pleurochrysis_carterae.AAC.1